MKKFIKKHKKLWIFLVILVILVILAGVMAYKYHKANTKAYVQKVSDINNNYILQNDQQEGQISDAATQSITLKDNETVAEVYVKQGDSVSTNQALFKYDTESLKLQEESYELEAKSDQAQLEIDNKQLAAYQKITPVAAADTKSQTDTVADTEDSYTLSDQQKVSSTPEAGTGTESDPYQYTCTKNSILTSEQINAWIAEGVVAELTIAPEASSDNEQHIWKIAGNYCLPVADNLFWSVETQSIWDPPAQKTETTAPAAASNAPTYTQAEKDKMIADKQTEITKLKNSIELAENQASQEQDKIKNATVCATVPGIVKTIGDPKNPPKDGSAFCTITGSNGLTVTGYLNEFDLEKAKTGDKISVTSYSSGGSSTAKITEISDYPSENYSGSTSGNTNVSYYSYQAYIEDATGFKIGDSVGITPYIENMDQVIVLDKIYVRQDADGHYVMIDNGHGRLKKQKVTIQTTSDSQYVEIKTGLSLDDELGWPYGKKAAPGTKTTTTEPLTLF